MSFVVIPKVSFPLAYFAEVATMVETGEGRCEDE